MRKSHLSITKPFSLRESINFSGRNILQRHRHLGSCKCPSLVNIICKLWLKLCFTNSDQHYDSDNIILLCLLYF